jgi:LysM repeat protein
MAARGMFFGEGPTACPFVALESDRDRRSDEPDHRHRCYAEPDPAPRALAHQRSYCLSAAFTTCPIFQDWAIRAAATPVPLRPGRMGDTERDEHPVWAAPPPWLAEPEAGSTSDGPHAEPDAEAARAEPDAEAARAEPDAEAPGFIAPPEMPPADIERVPSLPAAPRADPEPPVRGAEPEPRAAEPPLPAFLAGRADQYQSEERGVDDRASLDRVERYQPDRPESDEAAASGHLPHETLRREDVVPVWGRKPVYGQTRSRLSLGDTGDVLSKITTMLAIGAILALAVVVIILAPSLLGFLDGGPPGPTVPGGGAASPTLAAPTASPTPAPTPSPSPRIYTVQAGDTLFSIARRHGLTVEQLLAANPQITNPNLVQIGQVLTIPDDDFGLFSPSPSP